MKRRPPLSIRGSNLLITRPSVRNPSGYNRTEGGGSRVGPRPLLADSQEEESSLCGDKIPTNGTGGGRWWETHEKAETITVWNMSSTVDLDHVQQRNNRSMLIKAQRLVQLGEPFKKCGEEIDSVLDIVRSSSLPDGVHR